MQIILTQQNEGNYYFGHLVIKGYSVALVYPGQSAYKLRSSLISVSSESAPNLE